MSNATASADDLLAVKGVSTVEVDADGVTRLNGTLDKVLLVKAEADATLSLAGLEGAQGSVVLSDSTIPSISDLLDVVSYVGGYVRATNVTSIEGSPGDIANLTAAVTAKDLLIGQVALAVSEVGVTEITATALNNVVPDLPGVTVDAKAYSTIRGSDADIAKIITDGVITLKENFNVVLTNTNDADAAKINTIIDESASGAIDFTNVTKITGLGEDVGDIVDLVGSRVTNFGTVDVVLSDTDTIDAKALTDLQSALSGGTVDASGFTAVTGKAAEVASLGEKVAVDGDISIGNPTIGVTDDALVSQLKNIMSQTSGVVTATVKSTEALADLKTLTDGTDSNALTITPVAGSYDPVDLLALSALTSVDIVASAVTEVKGDPAKIDLLIATNSGVALPANVKIETTSDATISQINDYVTASGTEAVTSSITAKASEMVHSSTGLTSTGTDAVTITVGAEASSAATSAADLVALTSATSEKVLAGSITSISGDDTAMDQLHAAATAGTPTVELKADFAADCHRRQRRGHDQRPECTDRWCGDGLG